LKEEIMEIISKEGGGRESEPLDALTESARLRKTAMVMNKLKEATTSRG
jgi:hypothetical protein